MSLYAKYGFVFCEPIIEPGSDVELMSSYLSRCANVNFTSTSHLIASLEKAMVHRRARGKKSKRSQGDMYNVNGIGPLANDAVDALAGVEDLNIDFRNLTLIKWRPWVDFRLHGVLRPNRMWCAQCWAEDIDRGIDPYIRLLWSLHSVTACYKHKCFLEDRCPKCDSLQDIVTSFPRQWYCFRCGNDLLSDGQDMKGAGDEAMWKSRGIASLIDAAICDENRLSLQNLGKNLLFVADNVLDGDMTELGEVCGNDLLEEGFYSSYKRLHFQRIVDVAYRLQISPDQLLGPNFVITTPHEWRPAASRTKYRKSPRKIDTVLIRENINKCLSAPEAISLKNFCKDNDMYPEVFRGHFPKSAELIQQRYSRKKKFQRLFSRLQRAGKIYQASFDMISQGSCPSERSLREKTDLKASDFRRDDVKRLIAQIQEKFGKA